MMHEKLLNNYVTLYGEIDSTFDFSHEVFGEGFYLFKVKIKRLSDTYDIIPCMISERLINVNKNMKGKFISIEGQYRSYNKVIAENKTQLQLSVFVREINLDGIEPDNKLINDITLIGYITKEPIYRKTPKEKEVTDLLLAVGRPYGKSDYIPCLEWGRNARYAATLKVGDKVEIRGRIQNREYTKKLSETESIARVAYEVSGRSIDLIRNENNKAV